MAISATSALPPPTLDPLAAPEPKRRESSIPMVAWIALAAVAGVATFFLIRQPGESAPHSLAPVVVASAEPAEEPLSDMDPAEAEPAAEAPDEEPTEPVEAEPAADVEVVDPVSPMTPPTRPTSMVTRMTSEPAEPAPAMQALAMTPEVAPEPVMRPSTSDTLPETPTRAEVQAALLSVRGNVQECMGRGGRVPVRVTVLGATGRVTTAEVQDAYFARQPTGGCIARAVRRASFPRFQQTRLVIVYPYEF